jgi:DNA-binding LacI/PurR family transcriptional regulator
VIGGLLSRETIDSRAARAFQKRSRLPERPAALLCSNDMTAIGVMREACELGIRVREDF